MCADNYQQICLCHVHLYQNIAAIELAKDEYLKYMTWSDVLEVLEKNPNK